MTLDLRATRSWVEAFVEEQLGSVPDVQDVGQDLDPQDLELRRRLWHRSQDVVAVVADLKASTSLSVGRHPRTTAAILEAATGSFARVSDDFECGYRQLQGDGLVSLYWGDARYERAVCAAITIKTLGAEFADKVHQRHPKAPATGVKVGMAAGSVLVKNVGTVQGGSEPLWAGKPVNYAAKCAQQADADEMLVTATVWDRLEGNDFISHSCDCQGGPSPSIWQDAIIEHLAADDEKEKYGRRLTSRWCDVHGPSYCAAVLEGQKTRDDVEPVRLAYQKSLYADRLRSKAKEDRENARRYRSLR